LPRRFVSLGVARVAAFAMCLAGCQRKHVRVDVEPELGYPACTDGGTDDRGVAVAARRIRSGPYSQERDVVERFELWRTACGYTLRERQEWPRATSDVEVRYDRDLVPIWAWKRMTIPGSRREDGNADLRRYEMRTGDVFIKRRDAEGETTLEKLLPGGRRRVPAGMRVGAVIAPGRGAITPWLKRANLAVGARVYDLVLDFRNPVETLEIASLERNEDRFEPTMGSTVRVYTFYGKETVFADADDAVVGDLAGMRPSDSLPLPEPAPMPMYGEPDPARGP
jgi:hypothetical protein